MIVRVDDPIIGAPDKNTLDAFFAEIGKHLKIKRGRCMNDEEVRYLGKL